MDISFFDLLGVRDEASPRDAATARWPADWIQTSTGTSGTDLTSIGEMVTFLDAAMTLHSVRPGAFPGGLNSGEAPGVGLVADLLIGATPPPFPLVFAALPKVEFHLLQTAAPHAKLYVKKTASGVEWIVEALPVEIRLPPRFLTPLEPKPGDPIPLTATVIDGFLSGKPDTLKVVLNSAEGSSIFVHVKLRVTEQFDFVLETAVPLSIGPCRFTGIPCKAIHDLNFILSPKPSDSLDPRAEALEWVRHDLSVAEQSPGPPGFITVRTVDLQIADSPLQDAETQANQARDESQRVEGVLEDLVIPTKSPFPIPVHFLAGIRRSLGVTDDPNGIFNLTDHPVVTPLMEGSGPDNDGGLYLILEQFLIRSIADGSLTDPQSVFVNLVFSDDPKAKGKSVTVELTDEWTLEAGLHFEPPKNIFTLFGAHVQASGVRAGVSFKRLFSNSPDHSVLKSLVLLADLVLILGEPQSDPVDQQKDPLVKLTPTSEKPSTVVINNIGLKFGDFTIGDFWNPNATELKAAGVIRLSVDEFGFVTEPNGARYFSFSGSWPLFGTPTTKPKPNDPSSTDSSKDTGSLGIQFYRLRWKIRGPRDASDLLIDGLGLAISYKTFSLVGFGMLSDYLVGDTRFREVGVVLQVQAEICKANIVFGGQFLHGHANGPSVNYTYLLAGLEVSPIPIAGAVQLVNVRGLFAWNMAPKLGPADAGTGQSMQLFDWYQAHSGGTTLPPSRNISVTGWEPKENSWAFAAGAGVTLGGSKAVTIDAFFLYLKSPAVTGFLAALQIFLFNNKKPVAYGVLEMEGDRWSLLVGLSLGMKSVTGKDVPLLSNAPVLTGTLYATNQPATFAIGHIDDTTTWLAFHIVGKLWIFNIEFFAGMCLQLVDTPDGPRVFGLRVAFSGGSRLSFIGGIDFYLTLEIIAGVWRNESRVSGFVVWLEGGIHVDVLWVFQFGASFKVEWDYLGPDPAYRRIACEVHIHTPWWMPDKTFRWNRTISQPQLEKMATVSTPVIEATAHPLAQSDTIPVAVSPLVGAAIDDKATFNLAELTGLTPPPWPPDVIAKAAPVAIDSAIALHFKASVDDKLVWGQITPPGMGTQASNDVSTRYELVEMGIRRKPRFGPGSATWTTLLDPAKSRVENLLNVPPQDLPALFRSPLGLRWDADFQREQKLDPRHFLLNAELPYLFFTTNFQADENLVRNMPGWPCCPTFQKGVPFHTVSFQDLALGARAPRMQFFTQSASTLRWVGIAPPTVRTSPTQAGLHVARLQTAALTEGAFARINFDTPAINVQIMLNWPPLHIPRAVVISSFRGLKLVNERTLSLTVATQGPINIHDPLGVTHLVLRITGAAIPGLPAGTANSIDFTSFGYQALDEVRDSVIGGGKCGASDPSQGGNGSRFAWLPNHDYEVSLRTRVTVKDDRSGTLQQELPQLVFFRTKGLPGLNSTPRTGQELDPYVESVYPAVGTTLYRSEPAILAFNEKFDILQGLDHPPLPADPDERKQRLDWVLAAELIAGNSNPARASVPSTDWVVAHRGTAPPPFTRGPRVIGLDPADPILRALTRLAQSTDPMQLRFQAVVLSPGGCNKPAPPPRKTRILSHDPVDPSDPLATPRRWPAGTPVRMNMRIPGSPFIERKQFEDPDATAFTPTAGAWRVAKNAIGPGSPNPATTQFAIFGEPSWEHFRLVANVSPGAARAGIALAVTAASGSSQAVVVWIDEAQRKLRITRRVGNAENDLASVALPAGVTSPYTLEVTAFDDEVRAQIGQTRISAVKQDLRAGRLALAAQGAAAFSSLIVDGVDAYRFEFVTSRFDSFAAHIGSFAGALSKLESLAAPSKTITQLLQAKSGFNDWVTALALPLRASVERLEISARYSSLNADLLLIESPEPLPLGFDVTLAIFKKAGGGGETPIAVKLVVDDTQTRALATSVDGAGNPALLTPGAYRLEFRINRARYRTFTADAGSNLRQTASVALTV